MKKPEWSQAGCCSASWYWWWVWSHSAQGNAKFGKLDTVTKYITDVTFECINPLVDKQLELLLQKEKTANESISEIFDVIAYVFEEMKYW